MNQKNSFRTFSSHATARLAAGLFILWLGLHVSVELIILTFVVLGQGHFLSAYFYKLRHRQITTRGLVLFILLTTTVFGWYWLAPNYALLALVTQTYFMVHFLVDEKFLAGQPPSFLSALEFIPILIFFLTFHILELFGTDVRSWAVLFVLLIMGLYGLLVRRSNYQLSVPSLCFLTAIGGLIGVGLLALPIEFTRLIGIVILYHYANWYLSLYFRFRPEPEQLATYFRIIGAANLLAFGLYAFYRLEPGTFGFLRYGFDLPYFFLWTIIHLVFSMRKRDQAYLTRLLPG